MKRWKGIKQRRAKKAQSPKMLGKLTPYDIVLRPIITEKSYGQSSTLNTYMFRVHKDCNKIDVKESFKALYDVTPRSVRIANVPYKGRMQRKLVRRAFKKAIITLNEWESIEIVA